MFKMMTGRDWKNVVKGAVGAVILASIPVTGPVIQKLIVSVSGIVSKGGTK